MVVVVVVVVVVVLVVVLPNISEISIACAPCCSSIFSIDRGVVDIVGHPVNSVVALKIIKNRFILKQMCADDLFVSVFFFLMSFYLVGKPFRIVIPGG